MILERITLHNFGLYKGIQSIELAPPSSKKPVILFGGQNGAGKTTFLDALLLVLYGKLARCSNRGNIAYDKFLLNCINKNISHKDGAAIELQFKHRLNGTEDTYNLRRSWSQNGKGVREYLEIYRNDKIDHVLSDEWNNYVEEFIPSRIANLFFFDGEKIEEFAAMSNSSAILSTAIHSLLGIDIIDKLSNDLLVLKRRKKTVIRDQKIKEEIKYLESELDTLRNIRGDIKQHIASNNNQLDYLKRELATIETEIREEGGELFERRSDLEREKQQAESRIHALEEQLKEFVNGPAPLLLIPDMLDAISEQSLAEKRAFEAKNFLDLITERDISILNRMKEIKTAPETIKKLERFLLDDRISLRGSQNISQYLGLSLSAQGKLNALRNGLLNETGSRLSSIIKEILKLYDLVDDLDRKLASVPEEEVIYDKIKKRQGIRLKIIQNESEQKALNEKLNKLNWDVEQKRNRLIKKIESSIEDEFKNDDNHRIMEYANKVSQTLQGFRSSIIKSHTERIAGLILDSFRKLIRKQTLVRSLTIDPESFRLELRGRDGNVLSQDSLSAGERQLLAVSILWGLARASGRPLPSAIDTPLGRLDSVHRSHLVERYFPAASHQVLLFSTDEEIRDHYFNKLKPFIGHTYFLDYDDAEGYTQVRKGYFTND